MDPFDSLPDAPPDLGVSHPGEGERVLHTDAAVKEPTYDVGEPKYKQQVKGMPKSDPFDSLPDAQQSDPFDALPDAPPSAAVAEPGQDAQSAQTHYETMFGDRAAMERAVAETNARKAASQPGALHQLASKVWGGIQGADSSLQAAGYEKGGFLSTANKLKNDYVVPVVQAAQKYIGKPAYEAASGMLGFEPGSLPGGTSLAGTSEDALLRSAGSSYTGPNENPQATAQIEKELGPKWASRALLAADMAGQTAPFLLAPGLSAPLGAAAKVGTAARLAGLATTSPKLASLMTLAAETTGIVAGAAAEGGVIGALSSTTSKDKKIEDEAAKMAKGAAVLGGGLHILAVTGRAGIAALGDELATWHLPERAKTQEFGRAKTEEFPLETKISDPTFKPGFASLTQKVDGTPVFNVAELNPGAPRFVQIPLKDTLDYFKVGDLFQKHNIGWHVPDEHLASLSLKEWGALHYGTKRPDAYEAFLTPDAFSGDALDLSEKFAAAARDSKQSVSMRTPGYQANKIPKPNLEPIETKPDLQSLILKEDGVVKVRDALPTAEIRAGRVTQFDAQARLTIPQMGGGAGGRGNTQEIKALYSKMQGINKVKDPAGYAKAQADYFNATAAKTDPAVPIPDLLPKPPEQVPQPPADAMPDYVLDEVKQTADLARVMLQVNQKAGQRGFMSGFLADHQRGPEDLRQLVSAMNGANNVGKPGELLRAVRAEMPKKQLYDAAARDLNNVALGKANLDQFIAKHPEVASHMMSTTRSLLEEIQNNSKKLEQLGYVSQGLTAARDTGLVDQYVASMYRAHYMQKGQWAKIRTASEDFLDDINYLHQQNPTWNKAQVAHEALEILQADSPLDRYIQSSLSKPMNNLKAKNYEIPAQIKSMLGEETSGPLRIAVTAANQRAILRKLQIWDEVTRSQYFSPEPTAHHTVRLDGPKQLFGNAAGGYVTPELAPLISAHKQPENSIAFMDAIGGMVKGNQVVLGGMRPWVNNVMRNIKGSVLAGGMVPWHPVQAAIDMGQAVAQLKAWHANPTVGSKGALVLEAKQVGALATGLGRTELAPGSDKLYNLMMEEMGKSGELFSGLGGVRKQLEKLNLPKEKLAVYYDAIDTTFKFANYLSLRRQFIKSGMLPEAAARQVADRINSSFPNFEHVGPTLEKMRKNPFGSVAPYLTSSMEDVRVNAIVARRLKAEPDLKWRLLGASGAMAGAAGAFQMFRQLNGISDSDVAEAESVRSKSSQYYRPGSVASPFRDSQGRVQFYDLGTWLPELQLAQGMPDDPMFNRLATNLFMTPVQGSVWEQPAREVLNKIGAVRKAPDWTPRTTEGERGAWATMAPFFAPALPGAITSTAETLRRGGIVGQLGRNEEQLTGSQMAQRMGGLPLAGPVSQPSRGASPTYNGNNAEYIRELKELKGQMVSIALSQKPEKDKAELMKRVNQRIAELTQRQNQIGSTINVNRR